MSSVVTTTSFNLPVTVIPCDAATYDPIILEKPSDRFKVKSLKGGGTDITDGIKAALDLEPEPDSILVLTDGYTPYPDTSFKIPVVFGIIKTDTGSSPPKPNNPPWNDSSVVEIII